MLVIAFLKFTHHYMLLILFSTNEHIFNGSIISASINELLTRKVSDKFCSVDRLQDWIYLASCDNSDHPPDVLTVNLGINLVLHFFKKLNFDFLLKKTTTKLPRIPNLDYRNLNWGLKCIQNLRNLKPKLWQFAQYQHYPDDGNTTIEYGEHPDSEHREDFTTLQFR